MPEGYLTRRLVLLPGAVAVALLVGFIFVPDGRWESVFVELFATALGVLVTALYVDRIVRRYDERRWEGAARLGYERLELFAAWTAWAFIPVVQSARVGPAARELSEAMGSGDRSRYRTAMADLMTSNVAPALPVAMRNMDRDA